MFMDQDTFAEMVQGSMHVWGAQNAPGHHEMGISYYTASVTLEELFTGGKRNIEHDVNVICPECRGCGSHKGKAPTKCVTCRGQGFEIHTMAMGMGMSQQFPTECSTCGGEGTSILLKDRCKKCEGQRVIQRPMTSTIHIPRGAPSKHEIVLEKRGNQNPDAPNFTNGLIVVLEEAPHAIFERNEEDLILKKSITLQEALCGVHFTIPHLSGKTLHVTTGGHIIKSGDTKTIAGYGLPIYSRHSSNSKSYGHLRITFDVIFPSEPLPEEVMTELMLVLPKPPEVDYDYDRAEAEECFVETLPFSVLKKAIEQQEEQGNEGFDTAGMEGHAVPCGMQ